MPRNLAGRPLHAFITGGSRGIGRATAHLFARNGYRCTLLSRSEAALQAAVSSLPALPRAPSLAEHEFEHAYIAADVSNPSFWTKQSFRDAAQRSMPSRTEGLGHIDVLVNCAGVSESSSFIMSDIADIQKIIDTNLTALMVGTRFLLRKRYIKGASLAESTLHQPSAAEGEAEVSTPVIINMSSLLGLHGGKGAVAYAASKAGVLGFTRALAAEVGPVGIRVNAIVPGYVETDMTKGTLFLPFLQSRNRRKRRHESIGA